MRINWKEFRRLYQADRGKFKTELREAIKGGAIPTNSFSLKEAAEELVMDRSGEPCGREWVRSLDPRSGDSLMEAESVNKAAFSDITGQIVYSEILGAYESPALLWPQLCTVRPTKLDGEKIPGISQLGDVAGVVSEGEPYPHVGVSQDYIETPATTKRGLIVPVTKEAVFFDLTGMVLDRCRDVGTAMGLWKEKLILDMALGQASTFITGGKYKWKGTEYSTYQTSTPWINKQTNALVDWTDIENAELLWDAMTDPHTGEPILITARNVVVPSALLYKARYILNATQVATSGATNATHTATTYANPVSSYNILSSPMVYSRTSAAGTWFMGDFQRAFRWMEAWPMTVVQAPPNNPEEFNRDIVAQFKASEKGAPAVVEPRAVVQNTAT